MEVIIERFINPLILALDFIIKFYDIAERETTLMNLKNLRISIQDAKKQLEVLI